MGAPDSRAGAFLKKTAGFLFCRPPGETPLAPRRAPGALGTKKGFQKGMSLLKAFFFFGLGLFFCRPAGLFCGLPRKNPYLWRFPALFRAP
jgi:hypothetical protein